MAVNNNNTRFALFRINACVPKPLQDVAWSLRGEEKHWRREADNRGLDLRIHGAVRAARLRLLELPSRVNGRESGPGQQACGMLCKHAFQKTLDW
jgi:hypothetical protein